MRGHHESGDGNTRGIGREESNDLSRSQMLLNGTDLGLTKSSWPLGVTNSTGTGSELKLASIEGNNGIETKVICYDKPEVPTGAVTILVDSEWGLFEWFQRLGSAGAIFSLLPGAINTFRRFILDCIGLFHDQVRPTHSALFRYTNWDDLRADMGSKNSSFQRIDRMLSKGYSSSEFEASLLNLDASGTAPLQLGRVMDARNSEIDAVMLAPDLFSLVTALQRAGLLQPFTRVDRELVTSSSFLVISGTGRLICPRQRKLR